jgi:phospholipase/carboxylesterase
MLVMAHGANGGPKIANRLPNLVRRQGVLVLAPASKGPTWDLMLGGYGDDVAALDEALAWVFERYPVDPNRLAVGGYSDGASWAVSLGITNGDLFSHVVAFSPGSIGPVEPHGRAPVFVSHGTDDRVLPYKRTGLAIATTLERNAYDVTLRPFAGGHELRERDMVHGVEWFLRSG